MICPVKIAGDLSALAGGESRRRWKDGLLLEGRGGAGNEGTRSDFKSFSQEDNLVAGSGDHRDQRPIDAALASALRRVRLRRVVRPAAGQALAQASAVEASG